MSEFRIAETKVFIKKIEKREFLEVYPKIKNKVYPQLKLDPIFGVNIKKLKGEYSDLYRYRIGKIRLIFTVDLSEKIIYTEHQKKILISVSKNFVRFYQTLLQIKSRREITFGVWYILQTYNFAKMRIDLPVIMASDWRTDARVSLCLH